MLTRTRSARLLAALFVVAGIMHFVIPATYASIVPPWLPHPIALVYVSGIAELAGGIGILLPATRQLAGWGLLALLIAVFPANIQMLLNAISRHASAVEIGILVLRLPLQPLLMRWIWRAVLRPESPQGSALNNAAI